MSEMTRLKDGAHVARTHVQRWFSNRNTRGQLSKVHDWSHVYAVARHAKAMAEEIAQREGCPKDEAEKIGVLAETTGYTHDIVREATETTPHGLKGAEAIRRLRKRFSFLRDFAPEELKDITDVVGVHETEFGNFQEKTSNLTPRARIIAQAILLGDKLFEASGYRVLERRAFFVGKERMEKDLKHLTAKYGDKAPLYAVAMESCRRLHVVNALQDYPNWAKPVAQPLHEVQQQFYYGLLKHLNLTEEKLLEEMKAAKFPRFDKEEEKMRQRVAEARSKVKIEAVSADIADSAAELTMHFVTSKTPEEAILSFNPRGKQAQEWLDGIKRYRQGSEEYLTELVKQIRKSRLD